MRKTFLFVAIALLFTGSLFAQDSVDVTFYYKPTDNPSAVYLPGEFNNWGQNSSGVISSGAPSAMTKDPSTGIWSKTYRLRVGGQIGGYTAGAYEYKINENGASTGWLPDPLNPYQDGNNNGNSVLYVKSPTVFHFFPNSKSGVVNSQEPVISTYIYPSLASGVDTSSFLLLVDSISYTVPGTAFNSSTDLLSFLCPASLQNGTHKSKITVGNLAGNHVSDSTTFVVQGGAIQILNQGGYVTRKPGIMIAGVVEDTSIHNVRMVQNGKDTTGVFANNGTFSFSATYTPG